MAQVSSIGVQDITSIITADAVHEMRLQIGQTAADNGVTLLELAPQQASLEEAFLRLTNPTHESAR